MKKPFNNYEQYITNTGCYSQKRGFISRSAAKSAARKAFAFGHGRMRCYACSHCGYWHIGHLPKEVKAGAGW